VNSSAFFQNRLVRITSGTSGRACDAVSFSWHYIAMCSCGMTSVSIFYGFNPLFESSENLPKMMTASQRTAARSVQSVYRQSNIFNGEAIGDVVIRVLNLHSPIHVRAFYLAIFSKNSYCLKNNFKKANHRIDTRCKWYGRKHTTDERNNVVDHSKCRWMKAERLSHWSLT
jgi:hypothetical protein